MKNLVLISFNTVKFGAIQAYAGAEGHGGFVIRMPRFKNRGLTQKVNLKCWFEGRQTDLCVKISPSSTSLDEQIKEVMKRLSFAQIASFSFSWKLDKIRRGMEFTAHDVGFRASPDVSLIPKTNFEAWLWYRTACDIWLGSPRVSMNSTVDSITKTCSPICSWGYL